MVDARELAVRMFAVIDGQRWSEYETVMHPDVEMTSPFGTLHGTAAWAEFSRQFAVAFPDGAHTVTAVVQEGHRAAIEGYYSGTHTGPMSTPQGTVPATGRRAVLPFCGVGEERDGRMVRVHVYLDQLTLLAQLGLVPEPAAASA